jgi:filamentous hemagglutinin
VRDNFEVNIQRVVTLGGGDLVVGSTEGSIDAGRGSAGKGAVAAPTVAYDNEGNPIINILPDLAQSGIRSASPPNSGVIPGSIELFAPRGTIDAGEAGIAGGHLILTGNSFANQSNFSSNNGTVGGPATQPPSAPVVALSGSSGVTAGVAKSLESSISSNNAGEEAASRARASTVLGILSVDLLGFGDEGEKETLPRQN